MRLETIAATAVLGLATMLSPACADTQEKKKQQPGVQKVIQDEAAVVGKAKELYRQGQAFAKQGLTDSANVLFDDAVELLQKQHGIKASPTVDFFLALVLTKRGYPSKPEKPGDHDRAVVLWDSLEGKLRDNSFDADILRTRDTVVRESFAEAAKLSLYAKSEQAYEWAKEAYGIKDPLAAVSKERFFLKKAVKQLEIITKKQPNNSGPFAVLAACYTRLKDYDDARAAWRRVIHFEPDNIKAYDAMLGVYAGENHVGYVVDEINKIKGVKPEKVLRNLAIAYVNVCDERAKVGQQPMLNAGFPGESKKLATLLFEASAVRTEREAKKKEKSPNYALRDLFSAGILDYAGATGLVDQAETVLRIRSGYDKIKEGVGELRAVEELFLSFASKISLDVPKKLLRDMYKDLTQR